MQQVYPEIEEDYTIHETLGSGKLVHLVIMLLCV